MTTSDHTPHRIDSEERTRSLPPFKDHHDNLAVGARCGQVETDVEREIGDRTLLGEIEHLDPGWIPVVEALPLRRLK
jgi:hypothetical protein